MIDIRNNLSLLYDFYIVAKEGNFTRAAEKNFASQSNLSRRVQNLESSLNLKLINSTNKGIELTSDGERLFKVVDILISNLETYNLDNNNEIIGNMIIGTTRNIADNKLSNYLSEYYKKYPKVKVKVITDNATNLNDYLINHKIDVLIDYLPNNNYTEKMDIVVKAIDQFETCFACSQIFYDKEHQSIKRLKDLEKYNLVIPGSSRRRQLLDEVLQSNDVELEPSIEMPDSKLMIDFVNNNVDTIGYFIKDEVKESNLKCLDLEEDMPKNSIGLIYPKLTMNVPTKKFIELVLKKIES